MKMASGRWMGCWIRCVACPEKTVGGGGGGGVGIQEFRSNIFQGLILFGFSQSDVQWTWTIV